MQKTRLASASSVRIDLDDGSWILVKGGLDYRTWTEFLSKVSKDIQPHEEAEVMLQLLKRVILDWNFTRKDGSTIEFMPELVDDLDMETVMEVMPQVMKLYTPEKKSSTSSEQTSEKDTEDREPVI